MRKPFVAGNWKMNLDLASARTLVAGIAEGLGSTTKIDVAICPPSIYLFPMAKAIAETPIALGAQNCWSEPSGAFTGEVSPAMVRETGAGYVILGHSERRNTIGPRDTNGRIAGESNEMVAAKVRAVFDHGMIPIVCIGETLAQRDANQTESVLTEQLTGSLATVTPDEAAKLVVAYEPVWAIGTGRTATVDQAQSAHSHIRGQLVERFGANAANAIRIQYGGSVKPDNANELMRCTDVDGALVGGASLKPVDFVAIIQETIKAKDL